MSNKVVVIIVTYRNRFHFLKEVVDSVIEEGITKLIIVDNKSNDESRKKLTELEAKSDGNVKVLYLEDNYGSAGGFKKGLEIAYNEFNCEFIWLLDDDNKPLRGSLNELLKFWDSLEFDLKNEKVALLSYRFRKGEIWRKAIEANKPELILGIRNSFFGFHVKDLFKKVFIHIKSSIKKVQSPAVDLNKVKYMIVPVAPYGGLFFHKKLIEKIGYPNEKFYLYGMSTSGLTE